MSAPGFFTRLKAAYKVLTNRYEGAQPLRSGGSYIPAFVRDARFDANAISRWEMARKIRYWRRNLWLLQKIEEIYVKYTVGQNGIHINPDSSDHEWNKRAHEVYEEWCQEPCRDSRLTMAEVHKLLAAEYKNDGEVNILLTRAKVNGKPSRPAIQLVESHRLSGPGTEFSTADLSGSSNIIDGVEVDDNGKPIFYHIRDGLIGDNWAKIAAKDFIHIFRPSRIGQMRGITPYAPVLNIIEDLQQLWLYELDRAKINAEIAYFHTNAGGELHATQFLQAAQGANIGQEDANATIERLRKSYGGRAFVGKTGDTMEQFDNKNPSAATQWLWKLIIEEIATSQGVPMILVMPDSVQGTVARGVYDDANIFFRGEFPLFAVPAIKLYRYFMDWARYNDLRVADAPADWAKCTVNPPREIDVDGGRTSAAKLAEYSAGILPLSAIAGAMGTTEDVLIYSSARTVGKIKQAAEEVSKEMGVEIKPEEIRAPLADVLAKTQPAEPDADDKPEKKEPAEV